MKTKFLPILFLTPFLITACNGNNEVPETFDEYVDILPQEAKDGNILHAFCWSFNQIKNNLPAIKEAGFKCVQTSPVSKSKSNGSKWEFFYQPVSFSIAESSPLGTKQELKELCDTAEQLGISILVDVVFNHMATTGNKNINNLPEVDPEVNEYEPYIYTHQDECFHQYTNPVGSGAVTMIYSGLPDLNTGSTYIQERALSFLKECIDVGVDGFRFDAAKHIETPNDPDYPSSFWDNTLQVAKQYYTNKTGKNLYCYGEILNTLEEGREDNFDLYAPYFDMTDNSYINEVRSAALAGDVNKLVNVNYNKLDTNVTADNLVTWIESHDTDLHSGSRSPISAVARYWAYIASRKGSRSLFYARPASQANPTIAEVGSYDWKNPLIAVTNRFHNRFAGASEELSNSNNIFVNERYSDTDKGALLVDVTKKGTAKVKFKHLEDGTYWDAVTGEKVIISNKTAKLTFDSGNIMVLTKTKKAPHPSISISVRDVEFVGSIDVTINVTHALSATYQIDDAAPIAFNESVRLTLGETINGGESTKLKVVVNNADYTIEEETFYTKQSLIEGYFNILNLDPKYYTDYELYFWAWGGGSNGAWLHDYQVQDGVVLVDFKNTTYTSFLFAIFDKGHTITDVTKWDSAVRKQSSDILIANGFYNAKSF